jgi:hypothetical protein
MVSVFAAEALTPPSSFEPLVRRHFLSLSVGLSIFYLFVLFLSVFAQPLLTVEGTEVVTKRIEFIETSSIWLGPIQGLVVAALGVLFFLKDTGDAFHQGKLDS